MKLFFTAYILLHNIILFFLNTNSEEVKKGNSMKLKNYFEDSIKVKKWIIQANFNGFASASNFFVNSTLAANDSLSQLYTNYRKYADAFRFGFSSGGSIGFMPNKHFMIELGAQYTEFSSLEKPVNYNDLPNDFNSPSDVFPIPVMPNTEGIIFASNFKMLQMPLLFTFNWNWGKSNIHISAGPLFSYTMSFKGYVVYNYDAIHFTSNIDNSGVQPFGIGILFKGLYSYQILPNFSLYAGPTFQYRFNSLFDKTYLIRQYPYFIGLETGVRVHF